MKKDRNSLCWKRYQSTRYFLISKYDFPLELSYKIVNETENHKLGVVLSRAKSWSCSKGYISIWCRNIFFKPRGIKTFRLLKVIWILVCSNKCPKYLIKYKLTKKLVTNLSCYVSYSLRSYL